MIRILDITIRIKVVHEIVEFRMTMIRSLDITVVELDLRIQI